MSPEIVLFALRVLSVLLLLGILVGLFYVLWRDYRSTVQQIQSARRSYGRLVALDSLDGKMVANGTTFPLLPLTSLGRSATNHVMVSDSFASGEHAQIVLRTGQWWLEDRHSRNGTTLNNVVIQQPVVMTTGDIIGIGEHYFRLELE